MELSVVHQQCANAPGRKMNILSVRVELTEIFQPLFFSSDRVHLEPPALKYSRAPVTPLELSRPPILEIGAGVPF
jgi:hypothetical protein